MPCGIQSCGLLVLLSCSTYSATLKLEAVRTSETVGYLQTTRHHEPGDFLNNLSEFNCAECFNLRTFDLPLSLPLISICFVSR
jgi:hypothetical protein